MNTAIEARNLGREALTPTSVSNPELDVVTAIYTDVELIRVLISRKVRRCRALLSEFERVQMDLGRIRAEYEAERSSVCHLRVYYGEAS